MRLATEFLNKNGRNIIWCLIILAFVFEFFRDIKRDGDFIGYVHAGQAVMDATPIYNDYLNTWPPFFSIFSVPLAMGHNISPVAIRAVWILMIACSWIFLLHLTPTLFSNADSTSKFKRKNLDDWGILLPFLLVFRFVIDDISNIQINTFLLLACVVVFKLVLKNKWLWAALLLAFIVSLKVYPVFILLYFVWKRLWKLVGFSVLFLVLINAFTVVVFGFNEAIENWNIWLHTRLGGDIIMIHKNQSLLALIAGFLSDVPRLEGVRTNFLSLTQAQIKLVFLFFVMLISIWPLYKIRKAFYKTSASQLQWEFALVLSVIPILSPLAWKYYFVFLFPLCFKIIQEVRNGNKIPRVSGLIGLSILLNIFSTDGLIGNYASDIAEVFGCITLGTGILIYTGWRYLVQNKI
ncbi:MAG: DUF2029 domain-containing protein [Bacteroidetes bacterium]|nr:DUF2029 domain-containing protein [Bacteroidota bacterium]